LGSCLQFRQLGDILIIFCDHTILKCINEFTNTNLCVLRKIIHFSIKNITIERLADINKQDIIFQK
jgi:hypothetical protein